MNISTWFESVKGFAATEVWTDGTVSLSIGRIAVAALLVILGGALSRRVANWVMRWLPTHIRHSPQGREMIPTTLFVMGWTVCILVALDLLNVPFTAFKFLGGAVALGFGFGAQNLCSNLISGAIIKIARPYKVGDIVESDGQTGRVVGIGMRTTEVLTYDGVNLLVPNANVLAQTIINRTNYEQSLRGIIQISVGYDSDSRQVEHLLTACASRHPTVIQAVGKSPWVIFEDFGPGSLVFKLFFWVDTTRGGVAAAASDIRHDILVCFRKEGIVVPYPQLDVHQIPPSAPAGSKT